MKPTSPRTSALFRTLRWPALLLAGIVGPAALTLSAAPFTGPSPALTQRRVSAGYMQSPLHFEAAVSPSGRQQFISLGAGYAMTFSPGNATVALHSTRGRDATVRMTMVDSDRTAPIVGEARLKAVSNYMIGSDSSAWRTGVSQFERIRYQSAYPGVDLTFYGNQQHLEYDFEVAAYADPSAIRLRFDGADRLTAKSNGDLSLSTAAGMLELARPFVYQINPGGERVAVSAKFALRHHDVTFALGRYDHAKPLIVDPILSYVTYLGGSGDENNFADPKTLSYQSGIAVGPDGSAYVTGVTGKTDMPNVQHNLANTMPVAASSYVFVTKFDSSGNTVYSTYFGGSNGANYGGGIAVNTAGEAYVAGSTLATDLPVTTSALQSSKHGIGSGFLSKLNAAGNDFIYSTYIGGTVNTRATAVAVDANGSAYITGEDEGGTFLTTAGAYQTSIKPNAYQNAFIVKLTPGGQLSYGSYVGGEYLDTGLGIAVDLAQNAYITGWTSSHTFPVTDSSSLKGQSNAFVTLLAADGRSIGFSRYLGGSGTDRGYGIALDHDVNIYLAGITTSPDFPTKDALQSSKAAPSGQSNGFVTELDAIGLKFSTYLGGGVGDAALAIAVDQTENVYVTGFAGSVNTASAFPQTYGMTFPTSNSYLSGFVTVYSQLGASYVYSTLLGGNTGNTIGTGIAADSKGNAFVTGGTATKDLPTTAGAPQPVTAGKNDAFVAKLFSLNFDSATLHFGDTSVGAVSAPLTTILTNASSASVTITKQGLSNAADFTETDNCTSLGAQAACTFTFRFNPSATGARSSIFTYTTSASPVPQTITLSGNGTTPVNTPKIAFSPSSIDFGTVQQNTDGSQLLTISNPGTAALHISSIVLGGANASAFSFANNAGCATIAENASCSLSVGFTAAAATTYTAALTFVDDASGSPQVVPLTGKGQPGVPQAAVSATSLNFGSLTVGDGKMLTFSLTNSGTDTLHVVNVAVSGASAAFTFSLPCTIVAVGGSCGGSVTYKPGAVGNDIATLVITDDSPNSTQSIQLFGAATAPAPPPVPQAVLTPVSYAFADTVTGSTTTQVFTLSNPGNATLAITGISIPTGAFTQTSNCGSTLAAGASCAISIVFAPAAVSSYAATLTVADNAATTQQTASVSGHGIAPASFALNVAAPATTVQAGAAASFSIAASSTGGSYNNPVALSVKGLPAGFQVTFAPASVTPGSNGATSVMTIQTPSPLASAGASGSTGGLKAAPTLATLASLPLCMIFGLRRTARRKLRGLALLALPLFLLLPVLTMTGCGGGGYFAPTTQTYTITVTGTSGSLQQSTNVTLTVN